MINLRFHIISLTAVFLALAIGIVMGSSLLKRATVDSLRARQTSLDEKIKQRNDENTRLRRQLGVIDAEDTSLGQAALPSLVGGRLSAPVVVVASRDVDADIVSSVQKLLVAAGAQTVGTMWLDGRTDLADATARSVVAKLLNIDATAAADQVRTRIVTALADELEGTSPASATTTTTTTTPPADATGTSSGTTSGTGGTTLPADPWGELIKGGAVDWDKPSGVSSTVPDLASPSLRVVVVSGEGATVSPRDFTYPLVRAMAARRSGLIVAEQLNERTRADEATLAADPKAAVRGTFVNPLRDDAQLKTRITTIDDLDRPMGQLALVLALARPDSQVGHYGQTPGVDGVLPPIAS